MAYSTEPRRSEASGRPHLQTPPQLHWLKRLVDTIKDKDRDAATEAADRTMRAHVLSTRGPVFWQTFGDSLRQYVEAMREQFGTDVTAGNLVFSAHPSSHSLPVIQISKSAFPYVKFYAQPRFDGGVNTINYAVHNPELPANGVAAQNALASRFDVSDGEIALVIAGQIFREPARAAQFVMEKLFSI